VVAATNSPDLRVVNLNTFDCELISGHSDIVLAVDASPDGRWIASVSKDRTVRVWRLGPLGKHHLAATGVGHTEAVGAVSFGSKPHAYLERNTNSMHPLLVSGSQDRTIKVWDMRSIIFDASMGSPNVKIHPGSLSVRTSVRAHEKDINALVVAPNDKLCASASQDKTIKIWSLDLLNRHSKNPTLQLQATLKGHKRGVWAVAFSPVDRVLASASGDGTVRVWSLGGETGDAGFACIRSFEGHTASVLRVAFVNSGLQLISGGADGLLKLWALRGQNSACVATFERHRDKVWALAARSWVCQEKRSTAAAGAAGRS
jgi:U3 small nucleolar RNA-associated protein 13